MHKVEAGNLIYAVSKAVKHELDVEKFDDRLAMQKGRCTSNSWGYGPRCRCRLFVRPLTRASRPMTAMSCVASMHMRGIVHGGRRQVRHRHPGDPFAVGGADEREICPGRGAHGDVGSV